MQIVNSLLAQHGIQMAECEFMSQKAVVTILRVQQNNSIHHRFFSMRDWNMAAARQGDYTYLYSVRTAPPKLHIALSCIYKEKNAMAREDDCRRL